LRTSSKLRLGAAAIILLIAVALDLRRPPSSQWTTAAAIGSIHVYQATMSPLYTRMGFKCRFTVTCSHYGEEVVKRFGVMKGGWLAARRILRCGPWTPMGTNDPPPVA